ncbi:MAG: carbohydrate ABC transporter permease [Candidatus Limiplasma sp.]|nr:carbohydrate ABC transporter permease [Candidatus Limiplasma sp.]
MSQTPFAWADPHSEVVPPVLGPDPTLDGGFTPLPAPGPTKPIQFLHIPGRNENRRASRVRRWLRLIRHNRPLVAAILLLLAVLMLLPVVFTFLYSFFPKGEISTYLGLRNRYDDTKWLDVLFSPSVVSLRQYYTLLIEEPQYLKLFCNSALYGGAILLGQALVIPMTAYALSRFTFRGRDTLFFLVLMLMLLPFQVTMAPSVMTLRALGLLNTVWAIILPMVFSPFYIFLLRQFMVGIPAEIVEAGQMDGAGTLRTFVHVILPVCRPILGAAAALSFADCWNLVEQPLVYLTDTNLQPLSVMFNQMNEQSTAVAFAGAALYLLPMLLVYLYFQDDILLGVQLSELK